MELNEIVSPHYAFPVFGVLLCAFLVFAFGFKSPTQPPSFNDDQRNSKQGKNKRRNVKKSLQNGQVAVMEASNKAGSVEKPFKVATSDKVASSPKSKSRSNPQVAANRQTIKNKKNEKNEKNALKKKESDMIDKSIKGRPQASDGEWVQLLSRKEKKNRRREDIQGDVEDEQVKDSNKEVNAKEISPTKKKKLNKEKNNKGADQTLTDEDTAKDFDANKKEVIDDNIQESITKQLVCELIDEQRSGTQQPLPKTEKGLSHSVSKKKKNKIECKNDFGDKTSQSSIEERMAEPKPIVGEPVAEIDLQSTEMQSVQDTAPVPGGVAFDELGDIWQEPKNQKKKKKARRDQ